MSSSLGNGDVGDSMKDPGMGLRGESGNGVSVASIDDDASDNAKWAVDSCNCRRAEVVRRPLPWTGM